MAPVPRLTAIVPVCEMRGESDGACADRASGLALGRLNEQKEQRRMESVGNSEQMLSAELRSRLNLDISL